MGTHMTVERLTALLDLRGPGRYLVAADCHAAVVSALEILYAKERAEVVPLEVDAHGRVDLGQLADLLTTKVHAVFLTHVSSMTGARQEIGAAAALVRDHRDRTGAADDPGRRRRAVRPRLAVDASAVDVYTVSSHKLGGVPGSVVTVNDAGLRALAPEAKGLDEAADHVRRYLAAGSVHVEAVAALARDPDLARRAPPPRKERAREGWRPSRRSSPSTATRCSLASATSPDVEVLFRPEVASENAGILSFRMADRRAEEVGRHLEEAGIHVRAATRDFYGRYYTVPFAKRILPELDEWGGALRASPWITNTPEEIDRLAEALRSVPED
jgi:selenocysteine lyase/cysteine desulfurase